MNPYLWQLHAVYRRSGAWDWRIGIGKCFVYDLEITALGDHVCPAAASFSSVTLCVPTGLSPNINIITTCGFALTADWWPHVHILHDLCYYPWEEHSNCIASLQNLAKEKDFKLTTSLMNYVRMILAMFDTSYPPVRVRKIFETPPPYSDVRIHLVFLHNKMLLEKDQLH